MLSLNVQNYMCDQLIKMSESIQEKYLDRVHHNPFYAFSKTNSVAIKYMSLGRSFDSQLGNRMQKICMYSARETYGAENVPNFVFISKSDNNRITMWCYSYPEEYATKYGVDICKTQKVSKVSNSENLVDTIFRSIGGAHRDTFVSEHNIERVTKEYKPEFDCEVEEIKSSIKDSLIERVFDCSDEQIKNFDAGKKSFPVDLLYIHDDAIYTFEIKIGGGLDTKNRAENANEVLRNEKFFSFFGKVYSYFGTCYNNAGGDEGTGDIKNINGVLLRGNENIGGPMFNIVSEIPEMDGKILVGSVFIDMLLPDTSNYKDFIGAFAKAFEDSKIEEVIYNL